MARAKKSVQESLGDSARAESLRLPDDWLDQVAAQVETHEDFNQLYRQFQKAIAERVLKGELTHHLGYPDGGERGADGNARNGTSRKTILTENGAVPLDIPRDRLSSFTPQFVPKGVRRLPGFDETVLQLYARGLTTRELQGQRDANAEHRGMAIDEYALR